MESSIGKVFKYLTILALIIASLWLVVLLKFIIALIVVSAVIAYILDPIASYMEAHGLSRMQATLLIFFSLGLTIALLFYLLVPSLLIELNFLQEGIGGSQASELINKLEQTIHKTIPVLSGQDLNLYEKLQGSLQNLAQSFFTIIVDIVSVLSTSIIIPFAVFFILKDGRKMKKNLVSVIPNKYFEMFLNLVHKVDLQLGGYLRGQFLDSLIIGLLAIIALWILGIKYFVLIGIFAGLANMIPYVGPLSGMVMAVSVVFLNNGSGQEIAWVLVAFAIIQLIDNVLVQPLVLARSVNLHPLIIIFAIIIGGEFFGIIGMLIAIPVTGILKVLSIEIYQSIKRFNLI
ncbi:MAG: AI-2E family transporter [Calditrichaeota bacterium]|nr:MAG: AI-2E family transporter [Calditrichota bacterium]MBL1204932.1 AI-2E family transporter [Calditrichota bacterium]NOG44761.1 AI-2E family transporter [Calditrichota bacterium]